MKTLDTIHLPDDFRLEIHTDPDPDSPDTWGDTGLFLVGFHRQFWVQAPGWDKETLLEHQTQETEPEGYALTPLFAYIHGGVHLQWGSTCRFDSGQVGWVILKTDDIPADRREAAKQSLLDEWNTYLEGRVYGYRLFRGEEEIDSCWGIYDDFNQTETRRQGHDAYSRYNIQEKLPFGTSHNQEESAQ